MPQIFFLNNNTYISNQVNQVSKKAKKKSEKGEGRADYIFVKDSRNERSQCIMKTKDGGSW